jgi:chorismate dehydratase
LHEFKRNELDRKIRVAAVSYLNTKPLIYGFENGMMKDELELVTDFPASIADMLMQGEVDIALLPIAAIPMLPQHFIISNYCIATNGEVASVGLFSDVPIEEIESILLDYQSKTSVGLLKILLKEYWKIHPTLIDANEGYEEKINGKTAGLVIGDRAFVQRTRNRFIYDLGFAWKQMTGLPFVFATWVATKEITDNFNENFNASTSEGLQHLPEIIAANAYEHYDLHEYYTTNIDYTLDDGKRKAMELYFAKIEGL